MVDEITIKLLKGLGYNRQEAINIINGFNPDGSEFEQLPF